jgi:hypothetical protein
MADEQVVANAPVTSGEGQSGSGPEGHQEVSAQPPVGEQPIAENNGSGTDNRIPKQRFDQVIEQRNRERELRAQYESRIRELETRQSPQTQTNPIEVESKRLAAKLNIKEEAAREILESSGAIARSERQAVEQQLQRYEFNRWQENLTNKYKDYQELSPKMTEVWNTLPEHERQAVVSSPYRLEMFYHYVKGQNVDGMIDAAKTKAASDAYNNKQLKQAVTSTPGASSAKPNGQLSQKVIADMSIEEFQKRHNEINTWLENQSKSR